jgi:hypothetical protein
LPENGKRWVYKWEYDAATLRESGSFSRFQCFEAYRWLKEDIPEGMFKEYHICVPLYILLDSRELRAEYLAGRLDGGLELPQAAASPALNIGGNYAS